MAEEKSGGGGGGESSGVVLPKMIKSGDRQVVRVELRPGETTYVSWRKLMKEAERVNGSSASASVSVPDPPPNAHPNLQSRIVPGQPAQKEAKDEPHPHRFSAVIEKIERLYMGKDSSEEEELDDVPDDDQYDTEDSFIDDAELDEYFEVDNSTIKHDGFFVNRGKLERNEPAAAPNQQPKKRRRKDVAKTHGESAEGRVSNRHVKTSKMPAANAETSLGKNSSNPSQNLNVINEQFRDVKGQNQLGVSGIPSRKKLADTEMMSDPSYLKVLNGDASASMADVKGIEKPMTGVLQSKNISTNKFNETGGSSEALHQTYIHKNAYAQPKFQHGKPLSNVEQPGPLAGMRDKNDIRELPDLNVSEGRSAMQTAKTSHMHRKDGSAIRTKGSMLEKAIRELEKMVAESRPPAAENQEADTATQGTKRRLPREIKQKLDKVAKLALASQGKISKELVNRLMSILGHLVQLRTLKRNLKVIISRSLSAKQEKDNKFQQIKKEVVEMIKTQVPHLESKAFELQAGASDDFQEIGSEEKGALKRKFSMDTALEDKICGLYDLFVDGLDEVADRQLVRKLYIELAELWPNGLMDNHGIKRAICRAKERQRALYSRHKDQEKINRKKMLTGRLDLNVRAEASPSAQPQHLKDRIATESSILALTSNSKPLPNTAVATVRMSSPSTNGSSLDRLKQEKLKGSPSNTTDDTRMADGALTKKKVKRKPEVELEETHFRGLPAQQGDERFKSMKPAASLPQKPNFQPSVPPSFEQGN
ncbi:hypothetical protein SLEP1_g11468 [Rubroshorea leprosula]|uniref:Hpc2-related domain-containing protein n=1 Tax=Rubroshorea leprosula TaxID=152421 RepID=A0AAV5IJD8_9ROSI|nr:hypothetical protein SLEP1_g11468 [Rubroshorea leprosula]